jgi:hypothetical protein
MCDIFALNWTRSTTSTIFNIKHNSKYFKGMTLRLVGLTKFLEDKT